MCNDVSFGEGKNPFNLQQKLEECGIQFDYQTVENIFLSNEGLNLPLENSFVVDAISEELGIEDAEQKDIIVKLFDAVSQNDDEEGLSLNDFMLQQKTDLFLERQGIAQQFNSDEWVEIENPSEVYAGTGLPFEFEGAKIFFDAPTDAIIKYNSNTNEIVIIGGQGVYLELAEGQSLTVFDTVDCAIYANPGESNITISGPNCVVTKLETYAGAKNVVVDKGATLENVVFGNGDDSITVVDATIGNVNMGSGNDKLSLSGATVVGIINLGDGDDELSSTSSQLLKKINLGEGYDTAVFDDTQIFGDIDDNDGGGGCSRDGKEEDKDEQY